MKKVAFLIFLFGSIVSCATVHSTSIKKIEFADVEKLEVGKTTSNQISQYFGKPNTVSTPLKPKEVWIYNGVIADGTEVQKASFSFERDILTGMVWLPYEPEILSSLDAVLAHFKNLKFETEKKGWDKQGHSYSDDVYYRNAELGISFTVDGYRKTVTGIAIGASTVTRQLSSQPKKL